MPEGFISLVIPLPPMPLGRSYHKKSFYANEVLCYFQNKMDTIAFKILVKLGKDFFDPDTNAVFNTSSSRARDDVRGGVEAKPSTMSM